MQQDKTKERSMDKLKLIKTIVFVLTFLLIFSTLLFLGTLLKKTHNTEKLPEKEISLHQPEGSYIKDFKADNGRLYILSIGGGVSDRIIIFNTETMQYEMTLKAN